MELVYQPELYCPFPSAVSPHAARVQDGTIAWARRLHLLQRESAYRRLSRLQYGMLTARAYPGASREILQIITDWCTWLFLLDDQCDEAGIGQDPAQLRRLHLELLDVLSGSAPKPHIAPLAHGLWDLYTRLLVHAPAGWLARFRRSVAQYFAANVWEAMNRHEGQVPDSATYRAMRPFTSAVYPCLLLIELAEGLRLPADVHEHPTVQVMAQMTNNVISWSNDLVSLEKERQSGDVHNLVIVLANEERLPLCAAVERVVELHDAEVRAFITLSERLPSFTPAVDSDLSQYALGMRSWMRANLDWSLAAVRYRAASAQPTPA
jgi:5-epi-alpha-selinene synthase